MTCVCYCYPFVLSVRNCLLCTYREHQDSIYSNRFLFNFRNHQNYIMVLPFRNIPTHTHAYTLPSLPFQYHSHHGSLPNIQATHQTHLVAPQPTIAYAPTVPAEENSVLHTPETTAIPSPAIHYSITPSHQVTSLPHAHSLQYAPHIQVQPSLQYILPPKQTIEYQAAAPLHKPSHLNIGPQYTHTQNYAQSYAPTLDLFGAYNKQPKTLLDSYVPSSVVLAHQRQLGRPFYNHLAPSIGVQQQGSHQSGYNTIAYSTFQGYGHSKRSPISIATAPLNNKTN